MTDKEHRRALFIARNRIVLGTNYNISRVETEISYSTKSFITGSFTLGLIVVTSISLGIMFLLVMMGLPSLLVIGLFIGSLVLSIGLIAGDTKYTINKDGIHRKVHTMLSNFTGLSREQFFSWNDIEWYKTGNDLNRTMKEYNYLTIKFKGIGNQWKISDSAGEENSFKLFSNAFVKLAEAYNESGQTISARTSKSNEPKLENRLIKRRKSFYETFFARIFTMGITLFLACLFGFFILHPEYLHGGTVWKIMVIIIPGFSYLLYRTFLKKH